MPSLRERFHKHFDVLNANSSNLLQQSLRLRYQVYCVEKGYEDPEFFPRGMESDTYDLRSNHSVVRHRSSGRVVGTVRVILPDNMDPSLPFPVENLCGASVDKDIFRPIIANRRRIGEISRFAISKELRSSLVTSDEKYNLVEQQDCIGESETRLLHSQIVMGLFHAVIKMSAENELTHWIAVMEPSLLRLFTRFGFRFTPFGQPINYRGYRRPCYAVIEDEMERVYNTRPELWDMATESGYLWPAPQNRTLNIA